MAEERGFDLCRRDIEAGHSQHVVGAAGVSTVTVHILSEFVAAPEPGTDKARAAFLAVVPVARRACRSAYLELADLAPPYRGSLLVDQAQFVAGNGLPGRAIAHITRPGADEHVQHPRRAGGIHPEAGIVAGGRRGRELG